MVTKKLPNLNLLRNLFRYDGATDTLYYNEWPPIVFKPSKTLTREQRWLRWNRANAGKPVNKSAVIICDEPYIYHRILYAIVNNEDPIGFVIDHVSGDDTDNRPVNLEKVTHQENLNRVKKQHFGRVAKQLKQLEDLKRRFNLSPP